MGRRNQMDWRTGLKENLIFIITFTIGISVKTQFYHSYPISQEKWLQGQRGPMPFPWHWESWCKNILIAYTSISFFKSTRRWTQMMKSARFHWEPISTQGWGYFHSRIPIMFSIWRSIAKKVSKKVAELTGGQKPHIIVSSLHRYNICHLKKKMDENHMFFLCLQTLFDISYTVYLCGKSYALENKQWTFPFWCQKFCPDRRWIPTGTRWKALKEELWHSGRIMSSMARLHR